MLLYEPRQGESKDTLYNNCQTGVRVCIRGNTDYKTRYKCIIDGSRNMLKIEYRQIYFPV